MHDQGYSEWTKSITWLVNMMTSSNGNIFHVTGPLWGESTGHLWIPLTKASDTELLYFSLICTWTNGWANNQDVGDLRCHRTHYDVTVMRGDSLHHRITSRHCDGQIGPYPPSSRISTTCDISEWQNALQWHYNEYDGVSNHQPHDCLLNLSFRHRSKKTWRDKIIIYIDISSK